MATNTLKDLHAKIEHMVVMRDENCYEVCNENGWSFREKSRTVEFRDAMCEWHAKAFKKWAHLKGHSVGDIYQRAAAASGGVLIYVGQPPAGEKPLPPPAPVKDPTDIPVMQVCECGCGYYVFWLKDQGVYSSPTWGGYHVRKGDHHKPDPRCKRCNRPWPTLDTK